MTIPPFKAVGFDLGDTLLYYRDTPLNWSALYPDALRSVAASCGASPTAEHLAAAGRALAQFNTRLMPRTHEVTAEKIMTLVLAALGIDPGFSEKAIGSFFTFFQQRLCVFPETLEVLFALRRQKITVGILTDVPYGMPRHFVEQDLIEGGIAELIDVLLTSVEVGVRKPEPAGYLVLAEKLDVGPHEMIYIGNEPKDVIGARRAGVRGVLLDRAGNGGQHGQDLTIPNLLPITSSALFCK